MESTPYDLSEVEKIKDPVTRLNAILKLWREHIRTKWNLPWSVDASMMPQGGHTETFSSANLSKVNILKLIDSKIKFIKGNDD